MDGRIWAPSGRTAKPSGSIPAQAIDLPERPSSLKRSSAPTTSSPAPGPSATATDSATAELVEEFVAHCRPSAARRQPHRREGLRVPVRARRPAVSPARRRDRPRRRRAGVAASARGLPPTTPHTLRRAYVSLALLAKPASTCCKSWAVSATPLEDDHGRRRPTPAAGSSASTGWRSTGSSTRRASSFNGGNPGGPQIVIRATIWPRTGPTRHGLAAVAGGQNSLAHRGDTRHGDDSPGRASAATANGALTGAPQVEPAR